MRHQTPLLLANFAAQLTILMTGVCVSSAQSEVYTLQVGAPIEREIKGGEAHPYQVVLSVGKFVRGAVDQRGADVMLTLLGPDRQKLSEIDSPNGSLGPEPFSLVAGVAGIYRLEVRAKRDAVAGRYEVKIEDLREATHQDRVRIAALKTSVEARQLREHGTAESLRKAAQKYEEALAQQCAVTLFRSPTRARAAVLPSPSKAGG